MTARRGVEIGFEDSVMVSTTPEDAFRIADMSLLEQWNPAVKRSVLVSGRPFEEGARYECTVRNGPIRVTANPVLVRVIPGELVTYAGKFGPAHSEDSIRFESYGAGTRLTFSNSTSMPRWTRLLRSLIQWSFHRQARQAMAGAQHYLSDHD